MISIPIKVKEGIAPPLGNPFHLYTIRDVAFQYGKVGEIDTGLDFKLPPNTVLTIRSTVPGLYVMDWKMEEGTLKVAVVAVGLPVNLVGKVAWGTAEVSSAERVPMRFLEMADEGGRKIRGDLQSVKSGE
jgi:hypothetical protein